MKKKSSFEDVDEEEDGENVTFCLFIRSLSLYLFKPIKAVNARMKIHREMYIFGE